MNTRLALSAAVPALFAAAIAACSATPGGTTQGTTPTADGGTTQPDGSAPITVAQPGQLALSVQKARRGASGGKKGLVELAITLSNGEGGAGALSNPALFKLKGSDGLAVSGGAMPASYIQGTPCNPSGEVTAGAAYSCVLTFQLADNADPLELSYANPADVRTAKAGVTVEACTACGAKCTYLDGSDKENCGACGVVTTALGVSCVAGRPTCSDAAATFCNGKCIDVNTDAKNCGRCGRDIGGFECVDGNFDCVGSEITRCGGACTILLADVDNCGGCGKVCDRPGLANFCAFVDTQHPCLAWIQRRNGESCSGPEADARCRAAGYVACVGNGQADSCACTYAPR